MNAKTMLNGLMVVLISGLGLMACSTTEENGDEVLASIVNVDDDGTTTVDTDILKSLFFTTNGNISDDLTEWLQFMREEEKVARDLYLAFNELYNLPVFRNIAKAEQNHMNVVLALIENYGVEDPASGDNGVFLNEHLQELFNTLLAQGSESVEAALAVGALVEEVDIADLANVYNFEPGDDFKALAEALMLGSRNHLRAFNRNLTFRDITYTPQVLSQEDFDAIVTSAWERGAGYCRGIIGTDGVAYSEYCGWWRK